MRKFILPLTALALLAPQAADAHHNYYNHHYYSHHYYGHAHARYCRPSSGTTGLIGGGAAGAIAGHALIGGPIGIIAGAVGGALGGRAIDRRITAHRRCR